MSYEWLLKVISHLRTPEGPAIEYLRIDFIIDVHLSNGAVVSEGPECKGCALHPMPTRPLTGPGVLDDIMASLKTVSVMCWIVPHGTFEICVPRSTTLNLM